MALNDDPIRVLVVEDNQDDRELLLRQLRKAQMDSYVKFISDGREALDFLSGDDAADGKAGDSIIALFLDLKLPSMGGIELLRRIKKMPRYARLPVIVMTSSNDPFDLEECRRLNVHQYVEKPITFSSFSHAVANVFHSPGT
ncbi:two-component system response regulator [Verrucomicrobia bacterium LW23]|nr:two-component system response regulator [Verrucomicrobia bacterium LW23]